MIDQLIKDSIQNSQIFVWLGPADPAGIAEWISPNGVQVPRDLKQLWIVSGGGDIFESEVILCPLATDPEYDIDTINKRYWAEGIDETLLIFHIGTWISAVRNKSPHFVCWSVGNPEIIAEFVNIDLWYSKTLRHEYSSRYGLEELQ